MDRREAIKLSGLATLGLTLPIRSFAKNNIMADSKDFEVIIIGGSYSGLSAAMALGRSLRRVLIIDGGMPCNRQTPHSHNFITQDGEKPAIIAARAKEQVLAYKSVSFLTGIVTEAHKSGDSFIVTTRAKETFSAKKLIFATGVKDVMPDWEGFSECWGISVVHCPYCHGYEIRGRVTGILSNGERAFHLASLVNNLTDKITILTQGKADFDQKQLDTFTKHNIRINEQEISSIEQENGQVKSVQFKDGSQADFQAVYADIPFVQHTDLPLALGCEMTDAGHIRVNMFQQTTVDGVYACGDNSSLLRSIACSVHTGNVAGAMINKELADMVF